MCALIGKSTGLDPITFKLKELRRQITIQWIQGHSDILGNVMVDSVAKQACSENVQLPGATYTSIWVEQTPLYTSNCFSVCCC